jgi:hypothetical protein
MVVIGRKPVSTVTRSSRQGRQIVAGHRAPDHDPPVSGRQQRRRRFQRQVNPGGIAWAGALRPYSFSMVHCSGC